jgi:hypothetical protein
MSQDRTIEQRLEALEQEVAELKRRLDAAKPQGSWLDQVIGSMKDEPDFGEVIRLGAAIRRADRPPDES